MSTKYLFLFCLSRTNGSVAVRLNCCSISPVCVFSWWKSIKSMTWRTAIWSCGYDPISESELVGGGNVHRHPTKWMWSRSSTTRTRLPSQRFRRNWTMSLRDLDCCHGDKWCGCIGWPVNIVTENQKASLSHTDVPPSDTHSPMETGRYYASVVAKPDRKTQRNNTPGLYINIHGWP